MVKVVKKYQENYTVISNDLINDTSISWKAKGIFLLLWSRPDDWDFYETEVMKHSTDGRSSLRSGLKELEDRGYITRKRVRNGKGQVTTSYWELSDKPMFEKPKLDNPTLEKDIQVSTDLTKYLSLQSTEEHTSFLQNDVPALNRIKLSDSGNELLEYYAEVYRKTKGKEHPPIPEDKIKVMIQDDWDTVLEHDKLFELIDYHFDNLPATNDGKVYSFLHEGYRNRLAEDYYTSEQFTEVNY